MQAALRALNQIVIDRVIKQYAIGDAIGASFYIEARQSTDIDTFVFLEPSASGLPSLTPVYDALVALVGSIVHEYVQFDAWPIQILPDANDLLREAIRMAVDSEYDGIPVCVFSAEHLCAVALQTGRTKDYLRVAMFIEQGVVNLDLLTDLLKRHNLTEKLARARVVLRDR